MSGREVAVWALLAVGVGVELVCVLGLLAARDVFDRLHYAAAATSAGPPPIAAAVVVRESFTQPSLNAVLVAAVLVLLGPLLTIATARAARLDRFGRAGAGPAERP